VLKAARAADRQLIAGVALFDVFEGPPLAPGEKSFGVEVVIQPQERTLDERDLEGLAERVVAAVVKATGGRLR
jgi:phenylalanyl-tRNA synthetase beta chain